MMILWAKIVVLLAVYLLCPFKGYSTTPPESYFPDKVKKMGPQKVDPVLRHWYGKYADSTNPLDLSKKDFKKYIKDRSGFIKAWLMLSYANSNNEGKEEKKQILDQALLEVNRLKDQGKESKTELAPYFLEEILYAKNLDDSVRRWVENSLREHGGNSCPAKQLLLKDIDKDGKSQLSLAEIKNILWRVNRFHSSSFREQALEELLEVLPEEYRESLAADFLAIAKDYPQIVEDNIWILGENGKLDEDIQFPSEEPYLSFDKAQKALRKRRCNTARSNFLRGLKRDKKQKGFEEAEATAMKVEACYRRKGVSARLRFWRSVRSQFKKTYGFKGEEVAIRRQGLIYWSRDDFDKARNIFSSLLEKAKQKKAKSIEGRTIYTFARIEENFGDFETAIRYYKSFVRDFSGDKNVEVSLMSLVLLNTIQGDLKEALKYVDILIKKQTLKEVDERSSTALSFALFWGGRINYSVGEKEKAREMWRRVATEFYSTFYGAMGHYILEKVEKRPLQLQPTKSRPFRMEEIYADYKKEDRVTIDRVLSLLELGMKEEASCEISELQYEHNDHRRMLTKAMLLYAAGDWLEAIKKYGNLPRSFRHGLPVGMERLLFPRDYTDEIVKYAKKLNLDADLIYAIIRQESVFNPKARSPVGARGLMQLMPRTAKMEARRLRHGYISRKQRRYIINRSLGRNNLYDANLNLALGVHHVHSLLSKYKNPIFVLTSYNASPSATRRWKKNIDTKDILAFIEQIPYKETKGYVKLVLRNYFYYKRWYRSPSSHMKHLDILVPDIKGLNDYSYNSKR